MNTLIPSQNQSSDPKTDRRIIQTKRLLKDALLTLLSQQPVHDITVRDICMTADISRGTFYSHYTDQFSLLSEMENDMYEEIISRVGQSLSTTKTQEVLVDLLGILQQNETLFRVIIASERGKDFLERIICSCFDLYQETQTENTKYPEEVSRFIIGGSAAVTLAWFTSGMPTPADRLARLIQEMSDTTLLAYTNQITSN